MARHPQLRATRSPQMVEQLWNQTVLGLRLDASAISVDAHTDSLSLTPFEISNQANILEHPDNPVEMFIVSDNAADVHHINVENLDSDLVYDNSIFKLDGTTPVSIGIRYRALQIRNASGFPIGGGNFAPKAETVGNITCYEIGNPGTANDPKTFLLMTPTYLSGAFVAERSYASHFTVPIDSSGYAFGFTSSAGRQDNVSMSIQARSFGAAGVWQTIIPEQFFEGMNTLQVHPRFAPPLTDIRVIANKETGTIVPLSLDYQILILQNDDLNINPTTQGTNI